MKIFFTIFFFTTSFFTKAQNAIVKYYDKDWAESEKDKATYYAEFIKEGDIYKCNSYWIKSNILYAISTYPDTIMKKAMGLQIIYFKNGNTEDSILFDNEGKIKEAFHYYNNKQLAAHFFADPNNPEGVTEGFDETGKKIKKYIYAKEAEFKGGEKSWHSYIIKNVSKNFFNTKSDAEISVSVNVQFIIDENGAVIRPKIIKSSGINSIDMDALRVITSSPTWNNALLYNNPIKVYRVQPFTYLLAPLKK